MEPAPLILAALLACSAAPLWAEEDLMTRMAGVYGSDENPNFSCTENPVTLSFTQSPPHAVFSWDFPSETVVGPARTREVYDLIGPTEGGLMMRLEGEPRRTEEGTRPIWVLRPLAGYTGFCWGRQDWPLIRCTGTHHRCEAEAPTS